MTLLSLLAGRTVAMTCHLHIYNLYKHFEHRSRIATVREKVLKNVPGQGKVREIQFQSGKFRKNEKSHGKVREFQKFQKNC